MDTEIFEAHKSTQSLCLRHSQYGTIFAIKHHLEVFALLNEASM